MNETDIFQYNSQAFLLYVDYSYKIRKSIMPVSSQCNILPLNQKFIPKRSLFFAGSSENLIGPANEIRKSTFYYMRSITDSLPIEFHRNDVTSRSVNIIKEMENSKRCLHVIGDFPSGKRFFDSLRARCPLIVLSDQFLLPFENLFVYPKMVFLQIEMFHPEQISKAMNYMNDYVIHQMRHRYSNLIELFELSFDGKIKLKQYEWAWAWSTFIRGVYSKGFIRSNYHPFNKYI